MTVTLISYVLFGLGLGFLHAFDPDHVAAVSGLGVGQKTQRPKLHFAWQWSAGHGSALLLLAMGVALAGMAVPTELSAMAERSVAYLLIGIGALACWRLRHAFRRHCHPDSSIPEPNGTAPRPPSAVAAPLVGLIHGTAGAAPLLALLPIAELPSPAWILWYVFLFSCGVTLGMLTLGYGFSKAITIGQKTNHKIRQALEIAVALFAMSVGVHLLA